MHKISRKFILAICLLGVASNSYAQFLFQSYDSVKVSSSGSSLTMPWAGGLNGVQYSQMDLDGDGTEDVVAYDRSMELVKCFIYNEGEYEYQAAYSDFFPPNIFNFLILIDYNNDGKKDLFTASNIGMVAYQNVSRTNLPIWERVSDFLTYESQSGNTVNLLLATNDYPAIIDLDGDGDLDVLNFNTSGLESSIVYYKNQSVELGEPLSMTTLFEENTSWGNFEECDCGSFAFGDEDCQDNAQERGALHLGGKSVFITDFENDQILDLITSHEECSELYSYSGASSGINPAYNAVDTNFPNSIDPALIDFYPNTMPLVDSENNRQHLVISPNIKTILGRAVDFKSSNWFYKKQASGTFELQTKSFLQENMIDWGLQASPAFYDIDQDGDLDMFIACSNGLPERIVESGIAYYENTGTSTAPDFLLRDDDYLNFKATDYSNLLIQFIDFNRDGAMDLAFQAAVDGPNKLYLSYGDNNGIDIANAIEISNVFIGINYSFHFADVSGDAAYDLLVGKASGGLILYENTSSTDVPSFVLRNNNYLLGDEGRELSSIKVTTADLDNDLKEDLLITDLSGVVKIYSDYKSGSQLFDTLLVYNEIVADFSTSRLGARNTIVVANLFDNELGSVMLGTISGGVKILRNTKEFPVESSVTNENLQIFPNPNNGSTLNIRLARQARVRMIDLSGKSMINYGNLAAGLNIISVNSLKNGLYIITAQFENGQTESKRLVVSR